MVQLDGIEWSVWEQYKASGDFAIFDPQNPDADGSGMFHVKLSDWKVMRADQYKSSDPIQRVMARVELRRVNVDDQGRSTGGQS
jgi:hypothetical protein